MVCGAGESVDCLQRARPRSDFLEINSLERDLATLMLCMINFEQLQVLQSFPIESLCAGNFQRLYFPIDVF